MKKIILLLLVGFFMTAGIFAEEEAEEKDISQYIDMFTTGSFEDVQFEEVFDKETTDSFATTDVKDEITTAMVEAGIDPEMQANTLDVMDLIATGDLENLAQLDDPEWQADNPDIDFTLEDINDGITVLIADQVSKQLFTEGESDDIKETFKTLANGLKMLSEFGQANAQSSVSSSLFGYQGYKLFAVSFGTLVSVSADSSTMKSVNSMLKDTDTIADELEKRLKEGGFAAGFAMQGFTASFGLNLSWLIDKLYVGAVFGSMNIGVSSDGAEAKLLGISIYNDPGMTQIEDMDVDLSLQTSTFGLTANYQLIKPIGIPILLRWNGISLGSGFIVNTFNINAKIASLTALLGENEEDSDAVDLSSIELGARFGINSTSYTIPLEASTGVQLLSTLTVTAGVGIDINFGTSNVNFEIISPNPDDLLTKVITEILNQALIESETGVNFPYSSQGNINLINPRLMAGVGIGLGPATFDVSLGYYLLSGFTIGANVVVRI